MSHKEKYRVIGTKRWIRKLLNCINKGFLIHNSKWIPITLGCPDLPPRFGFCTSIKINHCKFLAIFGIGNNKPLNKASKAFQKKRELERGVASFFYFILDNENIIQYFCKSTGFIDAKIKFEAWKTVCYIHGDGLEVYPNGCQEPHENIGCSGDHKHQEDYYQLRIKIPPNNFLEEILKLKKRRLKNKFVEFLKYKLKQNKSEQNTLLCQIYTTIEA